MKDNLSLIASLLTGLLVMIFTNSSLLGIMVIITLLYITGGGK